MNSAAEKEMELCPDGKDWLPPLGRRSSTLVFERVSHAEGHGQRLSKLQSTLAIAITESQASRRGRQNEL